MNRILSALLLAALCACSNDAADTTMLEYPDTVRTDHIDTYHGTAVSDPYRWLEDDVRESEDVANWVERQNETTFAYLDTIPERDRIAARLRALWDYERYGVPVGRGKRYFFEYNDGLQNQDVLRMQRGLDAPPETLLDPNRWSDDGTMALAEWYPSKDGRHVAYLVQEDGSDWRVARVIDTDNGTVLDDRLEWLKFTALAWAADGSGFYYSRYPATDDEERFQSLNTDQSVWFHRLGQPQSDDRLVYARPDNPGWGFLPEVTDDGRYLVLTIWKGTDERYQIAVQDLEESDAKPRLLIEGFDFDYTLAGSIEGILYFRTSNDAPRGKLIAIDLEAPSPTNWREVIPQSAAVLKQVSLVGGRFVAEYMQDAWTLVRLFEADGAPAGDVDLPGIGSATGFKGTADNPETFFIYESFDTPPAVNRLNVASGAVEPFKRAQVDFDSDDFVVEQVFYRSKDGTEVPMFVTRPVETELDGTNPVMLYGYGGFNISMQPEFSVAKLAWLEMGGIWAVANLRGGGEYGEAWHKAGTRLQKQNVFDDFIAAAEYLIHERYTNRERLAIFGGSNGGLLVGAVTNQRPDLFAVALPAVGVMDMLRFQEFTAGRFWVDDYGSVEDADEFRALHAYSPYHNVAPGTRYPAILATTADTDDRVVPGHSFKYAAAVQAAQGGDAPVLIRIERRAGHGAGTPTDKAIALYADRWGFAVENLGMRLPEGYGSD